MRKFKTVFMRGGTSKGCMFIKDNLPEERSEWDSIFLQIMGNPDPKQIDGLGGTVSSNNKIVIVWKSDKKDIDIEYLVGQVIVGECKVDYKSNCGNMTAAVAPFAIEEGLVDVVEPITTVRLLNNNTNKLINITVPCEDGTISQKGDCKIAGVDGTGPELKVDFLNPAGSKTEKLFPTGNHIDNIILPKIGEIEISILDVSNPMVLVKAEDIGIKGTELPDEINNKESVCDLLEVIRGQAACMMGLAKDLKDAKDNSPAVPKIGIFTKPQSYNDIEGNYVDNTEMDICVRVMSVFKCHKACPLTSASAISVAAFLNSTILEKDIDKEHNKEGYIRIGHPSGVMMMYPNIENKDNEVRVHSVAVARTARRIMDGIVYIKD